MTRRSSPSGRVVWGSLAAGFTLKAQGKALSRRLYADRFRQRMLVVLDLAISKVPGSGMYRGWQGELSVTPGTPLSRV